MEMNDIPTWLDIVLLIVLGSGIVFIDVVLEYIWKVVIKRYQTTYEFFRGEKE